jgi:hypothetical protein
MIGLNQVQAEKTKSTSKFYTKVHEIKLIKKRCTIREQWRHEDYDTYYTVKVKNTGKYPLQFYVQYIQFQENIGWKFPPYEDGILQPGEKKTIRNLQFNKGEEPDQVFLELTCFRKRTFTDEYFTNGAEGTLKVYKQKRKKKGDPVVE